MTGRLLSVLMSFLAVLCIAAPSWAADEECAPCHGGWVNEVAGSSHKGLGCGSCHEGAAEHAKDVSIKPSVRFDLELCGGCHKDQYGTYVYGDGGNTKYGGSPAGKPKVKDFANYNDIVDGHGFTKDYNEERSHNVMLLDHFDIKRGKVDTCLQCKSTKVAYYWNTGKERVVGNETVVKAGHMKDAVTVPKGTKITMKTAADAPYPKTYEVQVLATLPDGKMYASYDHPGATKDPAWTWAALYALTVDGLPEASPSRMAGHGCNHCHNPHKVGRAADGGLVGFRLVRKEEARVIAEKGLNPYKAGSPKTFDEGAPLGVDGSTALCGQCHVEYVCGVSGVDKIDRDYFPWAKAADLEKINTAVFPGYGQYSTVKHVQDWKHGTGPLSSTNSPGNGITYKSPSPIGEVLTKSQHPEAETYWNGAHYTYGAKCYACHMPKVTKADGSSFTSHWMASSYKYADPKSAKPFAEKLGLKTEKDGTISPCGGCHTGKTLAGKLDRAKKLQDKTYKQALEVQDALTASLASIKAAKDAKAAGKPVDAKLLAAAVEDHRAAHVRWENLIISENSMGFHNPKEVESELNKAAKFAKSAREKARKSMKAAKGR